MTDPAADWQRIKELVANALELPHRERRAFLEGLVGESPEVQARVARLVDASESSGDPLEEVAGRALPAQQPAVDWTGRQLGGYAVKRFVARGGMGEVYEAVQESTGRRVALKLLSGPSSGSWRKRFRDEIGLLARLEHPAVAQILDADVHVDGSGREWPYFALEYVEGVPLTMHAERRGLSVDERVALLVEVAGGVQHAHQRGVIHRDLKPENILVTDPRDGRPQPKILDFGVARAIGSGADGCDPATHLTRAGELLGTLSYMSPEQALGDPDAVDTRSDVYGLGVLLFQLLTGRFPIDLTGTPLPEAVRRLREEPPAAPSSFDTALRGDLDTICATAMAREPGARYQSVSELVADLERYLNHEPITARPASRIYQLRMLARRHRGLAAGLAVALAILLLGIVSTSVGFVQAKGQARRAVAEAQRTRHANRFLGEILSAADPELLGVDVTLREVLDLNAPRIDTVFADDDRTRAELHGTVGWTYHGLGETRLATEHLGTSRRLWLELDGPDSASALAAERLEQAVALELDGTSDAALARAEDLARRTAARLGASAPVALDARAGVAYVLAGRGEHERAVELARGAHEDAERALGLDHEATSTLGSDLAGYLMGAGEYEAAAELLAEVHTRRVERYGASHARSVRCLIDLATAESLCERPEQALADFDRALEAAREIWPEEHPTRVLLQANRATALSGLGHYEAAARAFSEVHEVRSRLLGERNAQTLSALYNLGVNLTYAGQFAAAEVAARRLMESAEDCEGCEDDFLMRASGLLASVLSELGRKDEALPLSRRALLEHRRILGPGHFQTLIQGNNHARLLAELGHYDEALELFAETIETWQAEYPAIVSMLRTIRWNHARALDDAGHQEAAEAEFKRVVELEGAAGPNPRPEHAEVLERMVRFYEAWGREAEAELCRAQLVSQESRL